MNPEIKSEMKSIALISLGCDKNLVESERILGTLSKGSYIFEVSEEEAHIIIINTCGFIRAAEDEAREHIAKAAALKESGSCLGIIITGCFAQRHKEKLLEEFPAIDKLVLNTEDLTAAAAELAGIDPGKLNPLSGNDRVLATPAHYAYLKIAEGCDNACAYCTIPLIKGRYKSVPMEELLEEARMLAGGGAKELVIIAQDTACYGMDLYGKSRIHELLRELSLIPGIEWLRVMYAYPEHITGDLIQEMCSNPKICHYLDMPIQHSNGNLLKRMGRASDEESLRSLIGKLRTAMPDIILRTTVMTGFPGEAKAEFQSMLKFLEDVKFDRLGAFAYSREEGTPAFDLPDQLIEKTKEARRDRVMEQQNLISREKLAGLLGKNLRVLIDGYEDGLYYGRSYMDCPETDGLVYIEAPGPVLDYRTEIGSFVDVVIYETGDYDVWGRVCDLFRS